jgi:hypothetical protein
MLRGQSLTTSLAEQATCGSRQANAPAVVATEGTRPYGTSPRQKKRLRAGSRYVDRRLRAR